MSTPAPDSRPPQLQVAQGVARITLRRPAHRNRLHNEDLAFLMESFRRIDADPSVRVLVLDAQVLPDRPVFSAGYNIGDFQAGPPEVPFEQVVDALEQLRAVTICVLEGSVYGGATDLVLACDLALGAEGIEMRMPAAALGMHYYASGLRRYVSRLGVAVAKRAFLTAEAIDAQALLRAGYVQELVPRAELAARVDALAAQVASLSPLALDSLKQSLNELARGEWNEQKLRDRAASTMASEDFAEAQRAFQEKRKPQWKGR
ncbi:enoyl-CoA hydratase/isomerase family protein [Ramlibacter sp. USB13]|uniref:Enoyl-CoA hydratase/isomerase family protein n=1 Tax=Ramlibacter cellulosilyticus TaxID=2764187 RepID=A0A923MN51_9BURK|nr:enoyl-CoA hydratase-related protein [Ramlibacter cellulosilyticus]MBC5781484.1 enoyl-CoA hydratase/isomerase family protein [Ramlibacter cellulosilyticus]